MPSVSRKQHKLMEAVAHNPAFAKKVGIPQSVGRDFATADKGKKFKEGGVIMGIKKVSQKETMGEKTMGKVKTAAPSKDGIAERGKTKGKMIAMKGNTIGTGPMVNTMKKGGKAKAKC